MKYLLKKPLRIGFFMRRVSFKKIHIINYWAKQATYRTRLAIQIELFKKTGITPELKHQS